jgi:hypothetical protein
VDITDELSKSNQLQRDCIRLGGGGGDPPSDGSTPERTTVDHITPKRKVRTNDHDGAAANAITPGNDDGQVPEVGCLVGSDVCKVGFQVGSPVGSNVGSLIPSYWDSPEAAKLFGFSYQNGDNVYNGVQDIVTLLSRAQQMHDGYKGLVANIDRAPLTPIQIFRLKNQCLYLRTAYQIALNKLGRSNNTWIETCCGGAVRKLSSLGFNLTVDKLRLGMWNTLFRRDHHFPHPNSYVANGMKPKPRIFEVFPEAEAMISDFVLSHLDHFTVDMLRNEFITMIIPGLKQKAEDESVPVDTEEYLLLSHLSMQPLHYLGYTHDKLKKSYYVDGHEHKEQKLHRSKFIKKYLMELELRTHRWVQMSIAEFDELQSSLSEDDNDKIINSGYSYIHPVTEDPWIECHVDETSMTVIGDNVGPFGGNVSVRCPAGSRPLIIFGQDESIFNQFSHSGRQWLGPLGQRSIMPKSAGMGIMLSAFQSREVRASIVDCCILSFPK